MTNKKVEEAIEIKIEKRIIDLKAERDKFMQEANANLAAYNAAIAELEALLKPEEPEKLEVVSDDPEQKD